MGTSNLSRPKLFTVCLRHDILSASGHSNHFRGDATCLTSTILATLQHRTSHPDSHGTIEGTKCATAEVSPNPRLEWLVTLVDKSPVYNMCKPRRGYSSARIILQKSQSRDRVCPSTRTKVVKSRNTTNWISPTAYGNRVISRTVLRSIALSVLPGGTQNPHRRSTRKAQTNRDDAQQDSPAANE